jgi:hypothetical protein
VIGLSQRPLPDNTQHSQENDSHSSSEIRTHTLSRRAAADLRLRPRGHWDRHTFLIISTKSRPSDWADDIKSQFRLRYSQLYSGHKTDIFVVFHGKNHDFQFRKHWSIRNVSATPVGSFTENKYQTSSVYNKTIPLTRYTSCMNWTRRTY